MTRDNKKIYLNTPLKRHEYLQLKMLDISEDIQHQYDQQTKVTSNGWVYIKVRKGIRGLPQARLLAQELLEQ